MAPERERAGAPLRREEGLEVGAHLRGRRVPVLPLARERLEDDALELRREVARLRRGGLGILREAPRHRLRSGRPTGTGCRR